MIEVKGLTKIFEDKEVLKGVDAKFYASKTNLIIGRSGAGKTVFLKTLIGMVTPTQGEVLFDGSNRLKFDKKKQKELLKNMGVMFQGSALFDSLTILENVQFPLDAFSKDSFSQRKDMAMSLLEKVGLKEACNKYPSEISGGMMKRAALARALVTLPKYLFCDEPNSGLDPKTGESIDRLIQDLTKEYNITTIINTHDMNSVKNIGEHIIFLHKGVKNWEGSYQEVKMSATEELKNFMTLW